MTRYYDHGPFREVVGVAVGDHLIVDLQDDGTVILSIFETLVDHQGRTEGIGHQGSVAVPFVTLSDALFPARVAAAIPEPEPAAPAPEPVEVPLAEPV